MNTRRKLLQAKETIPSTKWHLMNESYYCMFLPEWREHVEYWYNMCATGKQREMFRLICSEIYVQDEDKPDLTYPTEYTAIRSKEEANLLVKYYGKVLTNSAKNRARVWILHVARNGWLRCNDFREVFTGCQTIFRHESVLHTDYLPPEPHYYLGVSSRSKSSQKVIGARSESGTQPSDRGEEEEEAEGEGQGEPHATQASLSKSAKYNKMLLEKRPTLIVQACTEPKVRFTKPKNQFDGFNILKTLGYDDRSPEKKIEQLKAKRTAFQESETYSVDKDGCTVYKARPAISTSQRVAVTGNGRILDCATSDPMTQWKVKICD